MATNIAAKTVSLLCVCSILCACNADPTVSIDSSVGSQQLDLSQNKGSVQATDEIDSASNQTADSLLSTNETEQPESEQSEYNFIPVLTEDDIEYMGIPYKDLTANQFIQLWAQCETENNVQRLYVISYNNSSYTDELTGEPVEPTELETERLLKKFAIQKLCMVLNGRMANRLSNVELFEDEYAPNGYYDSDDTKEHYYRITFTKQWYDLGSSGEDEELFWVALKKINGYWKIGAMMSSSPPALFLPEP